MNLSSWLADTLISLTERLLPPQFRLRYQAEFNADLAHLPESDRLRYALSALRGAPMLRWRLIEAPALSGHLACFLSRHQEYVLHPNPDDRTIIALECDRCGNVRDPIQYLPKRDGTALAWGNPMLRGM